MADRDEEFVEVSIEEFTSGRPVAFAIYIRLTSWKYLQIANPGEGLDRARVEVYKDKNVKCLYLRKDDFSRHVGMKGAVPAPLEPISPAVVQQLKELKSSANATLELLRGNGINELLFEASKEFVEGTISVLADDRAALNMLSAMNSQPSMNAIYEHSLGVTLYSVMLGRVFGWKSSQNLFRVGLGALLHDIGVNSIDESTLLKQEADMTTAELRQVREHPIAGAEILKQLTSVPIEVVAIALQHHEETQGQGYPKGLNSTAIHPMAKLVGVANKFCELVLDSPGSPRLPVQTAFQLMVDSNAYNADVLSALKRLLKGLPE